ncbi:MAG: hypothetical protein OH319_02560 [Candidatus Parvarchaeota archaeon]|nr:hypothetical protein [Candidatus Jingweiarchaeum tengchongense]MCW1298251.1 hypothetical protein [Candidatus Jingweiarchaeum tengchongense]MCW1300048.1 hypothetical protein [Candidatus Jingweiarchaeum tengchongense]MCW1310489.1 hypothetical protein [Candidatus Jingweiarchaeum tengchongense]
MAYVEAYKKILEIKKIKKDLDKGNYERINELSSLIQEIKSRISDDFFDDYRYHLEHFTLPYNKREFISVCEQVMHKLKKYRRVKEDSSNIEEIIKSSKELKQSLNTLIADSVFIEDLAKNQLNSFHNNYVKDRIMNTLKEFRNPYSIDEMKKAGVSKEIIEQMESEALPIHHREKLVSTIKDAYTYLKSNKIKSLEEFIQNQSKLEDALTRNDINDIEKTLEESGIKGKRGYKYKHIIGLLDQIDRISNPNSEEISFREWILATSGPIIDHLIISTGLAVMGIPDAWMISFPIFNFRNVIRILRVRPNSSKNKAFYTTIPIFALPYYGIKKLNGKISNPFDGDKREIYKRIDMTLSIIDRNPSLIEDEPFSRIEERCKIMFKTRDATLPSFMEEVKKKRGEKEFVRLKNLLESEIKKNLKSDSKIIQVKNQNVDMIKFAELCGLDVSEIKKNMRMNIQDETRKLVELEESLGD